MLTVNSFLPVSIEPSSSRASFERRPLAGVLAQAPMTESELDRDPLAVLRCDARILSNPALFEILLTLVEKSLHASTAYYNRLLQRNLVIPTLYTNRQTPQERPGADLVPTPQEKAKQLIRDREDLKGTLLSLQYAAAVQLLLEACRTDDSTLVHTSTCFLCNLLKF